jgi:hypothetical protein
MLALRDAGYAISLPFGENTRYDLIVDDGHRLLKVQCKTGRLSNGGVVFRPSSSYAHHSSARPRRNYQGEIDYFGVYCPEAGAVCFVPIADVATTWMAHLRLESARNVHKRGIRPAKDYEVGRNLVTDGRRAMPLTVAN